MLRFNSERSMKKKNKKPENKINDLNISLSSDSSFYETLSDNIKWDIIFLIGSGYEKRTIIKLYLYIMPSNVNEAIEYLTQRNGLYQHKFYPSRKSVDSCDICGEKKDFHIEKNNTIKNNYMGKTSFNRTVILPITINNKSEFIRRK